MEDDKRVNYKLDAINKLYIPIDIENKNDIQSAIQLQKQYNEVFASSRGLIKFAPPSDLQVSASFLVTRT